MAIKKIKIKETGVTYDIDSSILNSAATINGNSIIGTGNINIVGNPWTKLNTTSISVGSGTGKTRNNMLIDYGDKKIFAVELTLTNPSGKEYIIFPWYTYAVNTMRYYNPSYGNYKVTVQFDNYDIYLSVGSTSAPTVSINNVYGI